MIRCSHSSIALCFLGDLAEKLVYIFSLGFLQGASRLAGITFDLSKGISKIKMIIEYSNICFLP